MKTSTVIYIVLIILAVLWIGSWLVKMLGVNS